jgi:putative ABC transport system ATP-binding protein
MPDLEIRDLTIEYVAGGYAVRPLDHIDLRAPAGSLTILLGPSGCGKTSLLSCLGGILTPKAGSVRFGDVDVMRLKGRALLDHRRRTVGIVFQAFNLVPSLSALENVMAPMRAAGVARRAALARAGALLEEVGLAGQAHQRPGALSGGQQQRVAVARALALDPPLLLADEPTAHLDYVQVAEVLGLLRALASGERVVVVATHDQRLLPLADHVVELGEQPAASHPPAAVGLTPGEVLFRQGSWGELIYVIEEGEVEIVAELEHGREDLRTVLGPGDYFGEIGPLFAMPRAATARARGRSVVTGYTARDFRERVGQPESRRRPGQTPSRL